MIDGGLIANAPEMLGVTEAIGHLQCPLSEIYVLAVGTAARRKGAKLSAIGAPSSASWLLQRDLFQTTLSAQEALARSQCETLLGTRYHRVDKEPLENQVAAIRDFDLTTDTATKTLLSLAAESWDEHKTKAGFQHFFQT